MTFDFTKYLQNLLAGLLDYLPKMIGAIALLLVGLWVIKQINRMVANFFSTKSYEPTLESFLESLLSLGLKIFLFITVAGILGFQTTSLVAILGAVSLAVGLALQGSLANFAGGVLILIFKPYKVGDLVNLMGNLGHVKQIQIFNTVIVTTDKKTIILPNGPIMNGPIINMSHEGDLRIELKVTLPFEANLDTVREVLVPVLKSNPKIVASPEPSVNILEMNDGGDMILTVRSYTHWQNYWEAYFYNYEHVQKALLAAGIIPPKPERYVYMMDQQKPSSI